MAFPSGVPGEGVGADKKRLQQRADFFATAQGIREDRKEDEAFDEAITSAGRKIRFAAPEEDATEKSRQLKEYEQSSAVEEAERRGSQRTSQPNLLGLTTLPGVSGPNLPIGETPRSESKGRSAAITGQQTGEAATLSPELVARLQEAGLDEPVTSLSDPRLTKSADKLSQHYVLSLNDNDRVYVWNGGGCHQILTVGLHETRVESAAGPVVETLVAQGRSEFKQIARRPDPADIPFQGPGE